MNGCLSDQVLRSLLDGGLAEAKMSSVGNHLAVCDCCRQRADDLTNTIEMDWARGMRDRGSYSDAFVSQRLLEPRTEDNAAASRCANLDLEHELDWLDPPRQAGDLGAMDAYRVLRVLGQGGMGIVLLCHDGTLDRMVAIKVLRSDRNDSRSRERFVREARAAAAIQHDNVVTIHHVTNPPDGPPYLVMQYIAGPTLRQQIGKAERLPTREAARIAREIANGLSAAHAAQLVHRDIKPANIILDAIDGRAKIMDFGLVRIIDLGKLPRGSEVTQEGISPGTPEYMSPEQVDAPQTVDARTDVYCLGVTLYEMLTGSRPFHGQAHAVLHQVLHDDPQPPHRRNPRIPRELETICLHAMEKEPSNRYQTATAMAEDLHRWLNGEAILARPGGSVRQLWRFWKRHAVVANLALTATILLLVTSSGIGWQWRRAEMHLADARRHRVERDANAAAALRHREQRDAKAAEAEVAKKQVEQANGQALSLALTTQISRDTRLEADFRQWFEALISMQNDFIEQQSDTPEGRRNVAGAQLVKSGWRRQLGDWDEAAVLYQQAIELLEDPVAAAPDDLDLRQKLATAYQGFGEVQHALGNRQEALNSYLRARDGQLQLVRNSPQAIHYLLDLANSEIAIGSLYLDLGQSDQCRPIFDQARRRLRHLQHATSDDRDPQKQSAVTVAYRELGVGLRRNGDTDTAMYCFQQADEMGRSCIDKQPEDWLAHSELGEVQHQLGEIWLASGELMRAAEAYEEAASLQRQVIEATPLTQKEPRQRLARHLQAVSVIHRQLGHWQPAIDAIAEVQQLAPADSNLVYWSARQFAQCYAALDSKPTSDPDALRHKLVELAVTALRQACEVGFDGMDDPNRTADLDSIRDTPQFKEFLESHSRRDLR